MKGQFYYAPLYYIHSQALGERLSVGVLLVFPGELKAIFKYPSSLQRLTHTYSQAPDKLLRKFFQSIEAKCEQISVRPDLFDQGYFTKLSPSHFLQPDDSALRFDNFHTGVLFDSPEEVATHFAKLYIGSYTAGEKEDRRDDNFLSRKFKDILRSQAPDLWRSGKIKEDFVVKSNNIDYQFPFAWKNGSLNLVRPISFDVKREETIHRKAERYFGQFSLLKEDAEKNNWKIDVLIAPPHAKHLFKSFNQAVEILQRPSIVRLHEEKDLQGYVKQTIEEAEE